MELMRNSFGKVKNVSFDLTSVATLAAVTVVGIGAAIAYKQLFGGKYGARIRIRREFEPPLVLGEGELGCIDSMNKNMNKFLSENQHKHGNVFTIKLNNEYKTFIMNLKLLREFMLSKYCDFEETSRISKLRFGLTEIANHNDGIHLLTKYLQLHLKTSKNLHILLNHIYIATKSIICEKVKNASDCDDKSLWSHTRREGVVKPVELHEFVSELMFDIDISVFFLNGQTLNNVNNSTLTKLIVEFYPLFLKYSKEIPLRFAQQKKELNNYGDSDKILLDKLSQIIELTNNINIGEKNNNCNCNCNTNKYFDLANDVCNSINENGNILLRNRIILTLLWATHSNSTNALFWFVLRIMLQQQAEQSKLRENLNHGDTEDEASSMICMQDIKKEITESNLFETTTKEEEQEVHVNRYERCIKNINGKLPNLESFMYEVLRYYNGSSIYRIINQDFEIIDENNKNKKYKLRKGDWVAGNGFYLHRDENVFINPMLFNPKRFLNNKENIKYLVTFGIMCPGKHIATNILMIVVALLINNNIYFNIGNINKDSLEPKNFLAFSVATVSDRDDD